MFQLFFIIYLIGGIAAIFISMIWGLNREHIGMAFSVGAILCLLLTRVSLQNETAGKTSNATFKITASIWCLVLVLSVLFLLDSIRYYYLSLQFFISLGVLSLIIAYQILGTNQLSKIQVSVILVEIAVLAFFLSAAIICLFPTTIGLDSVFHANYVQQIIASGNLYTGDFDKYANYPVFHLTFAGVMLLTGIDFRTAELLLAFVQVLSVAFIFVLCACIFKEKTALLAALLIVLASQLIIPRYSLFPSSYAVIYFMLLLFVLFHFRIKKRNIWPVMLIVLVAIGLVHPFISVVTAIVLSGLYLLDSTPGSGKIVNLRYVLLSVALMVIQIVRPIPDTHSYSLTYILMVQIMGILSRSTSVAQATLSQLQSWVDMLFYDMGFMLLIIFGICGALLMLRQSMKKNRSVAEGSRDRIIFCLSALTLIMLPIPYVMAIAAPSALPERWFVYVSVLLGIFAAVALYRFSRMSRGGTFITILAVPVIIFFMITAPICNPNTHIYLEKLATTPSAKLSETFAADFLRNNVNLSRVYANSLIVPWIDHSIDYALNTQGHIIDLTNPNDIYDGHVLLIRDYDMANGFTVPLQGVRGKLLETDKPTGAFIKYIGDADKFYDSGEIRAVLGYDDSPNAPDNLLSPGDNPGDEGT